MLFYGVGAYHTHRLTRVIGEGKTIIAGGFLIMFSEIVIGPSILFSFGRQDLIIVAGLGFFGLAMGIILVPIMPELS